MAQSLTQQRKIAKVLGEFKKGKLKSSSGEGVQNREQALAIALSEAGVKPKRRGEQKLRRRRKLRS